MKKSVILLISLLFLNLSCLKATPGSFNYASPGDSIKVLSTPGLYNISSKWADEYNRINQGTKVKIVAVSDLEMTDKMNSEGSLGFISNELYSGLKNELFWKEVVGRDIIVPIVNSGNPFLEKIKQQGVSPEELATFFNEVGSGNWGTLLKSDLASRANYYWINDESILEGLTGFVGTVRIRTGGTEVENGEAMISAIQKDPFGIGFCKMVDILNSKDQNISEDIALLPIDRDGNGIIDFNEKIYDDLNTLSRGVWIGKYPKALFRNIYTISRVQPENEAEIAFLKWVITDGQKYLCKSGFSDLLVTERQSTADKLYNARIYAPALSNDRLLMKTFLFVIATIIITGLIAGAVARYRQRKKEGTRIKASVALNLPDENSLLVPKGIYFDKTHTWAFMDQNGVVKVGIDDFLQHVTGTITRIKMKSVGERVNKGEQLFSIIQNGKQLNLYAPVSGIIAEQNKAVDLNSALINSYPYSEGWIYKIEASNWHRENQLLFMADKHKLFIKKEIARLKDFLAAALSTDAEKYSRIVLQDGGELRDSVLSDLGPEEWEEFQTKFIDPSRQVWFYEII